MEMGFRHVASGPLVRSSYHADGQAAMIRALRADRASPSVGGACDRLIQRDSGIRKGPLGPLLSFQMPPPTDC